MRIPISLSILLLLPALSLGCEAPRTEVRTLSLHPRIRFVDAPPQAEVFVDGKPVGLASDYSGHPGVLQLEAGTHVIEVRLKGQTLLSTQVFLEGEALRDIRVPART